MKTLKKHLQDKKTIFTPEYYNNIPQYYLLDQICKAVKEWLQEYFLWATHEQKALIKKLIEELEQC
jgi:hypothetical protein